MQPLLMEKPLQLVILLSQLIFFKDLKFWAETDDKAEVGAQAVPPPTVSSFLAERFFSILKAEHFVFLESRTYLGKLHWWRTGNFPGVA